MWDTATSRCVRRHALTSDGAMSMLESPKPRNPETHIKLACLTLRDMEGANQQSIGLGNDS